MKLNLNKENKIIANFKYFLVFCVIENKNFQFNLCNLFLFCFMELLLFYIFYLLSFFVSCFVCLFIPLTVTLSFCLCVDDGENFLITYGFQPFFILTEHQPHLKGFSPFPFHQMF